MSRRVQSVSGLAIAIGFAMAIAGCPFEFEKEPRGNSSPTTFFDFAPPDTTFRNEVQFRWIGTDLDSDVVAYQFQLVQTDSVYFATDGREGNVLRSLEPRGTPCFCFSPEDTAEYEADRNFVLWTERQTENFEAFSELEDGWYEFRARAIDDQGSVDRTPARKRFYVFFDDKAPFAVILQDSPHNCGRLDQVQSHTFLIDAADSSRNAVTPRENLQYSCQLRARSQVSCTQHLSDPFDSKSDALDGVDDGWGFFPSDGEPVEIGDEPPFLYVDLFPPGCDWTFTLRVRDPAGNVATVTCDIRQPPTN